MSRIKILGIAPYLGLKELMQDIAHQRSDIELEVYVGDLSDGVELVLEHQRRGFSGIVSRGGTAEIIRRVANIPVTEVTLSVYDVLRTIKLAQSYNGKFAIVGFSSITNCAKILKDLLQFEIEIVTIKNQAEVVPCLETLKEQGCSMVLGDMVTTVNARLTGMNGILITSGGESVEAAFDHAVVISEGHRKNLEEVEFLHALLYSMKEDIAVFDENERLKFSASRSLNEEMESFMKKNITSVLERGEKKILKRQTDEDGKELLALIGRGFSTTTGRYCAFTSKRTPKPHAYDGQGVTFQSKEDLLEDVSNAFCRSNSIGKSAGLIEKCAHSNLPIIIMGEPGTGKDKTANSIYMRSKLSDNPMISINCAVVSEKKWSHLFESEYSPFLEKSHTIYVKNLDQLSEHTAVQLVRYFEETGAFERNRLIFSYITKHNVDEPLICSDLKYKLSCLIVRLPPLRQRPEDIPSLCSLYINEINATTGKGVIGLKPEAMALMRNFHWEYNLNQLQQILTQLVVLSDSPYISADDVADILAAESKRKPELIGHGLNLNQPLNDISRDIVRVVLSEESMNRSNAARRLQISRSTLWRMLRK